MSDAAATEAYVPKVILLTGGAGFIGSNTMCHLVKKYPDVQMVCLDKLDYCANTRNFDEIRDCENFTFVRGNITSSDLVNHLISTHKVDTIMHFAAESHVDNSFGQSLQFTTTNVLGTHTLLEGAKAHIDQIRRFIHVSTDEVYGEQAVSEARKTEADALSPTNPYAASKAAAEFMVKSYRTSFNLPTIITRGNNVYGPKQFPEKLIPKFINLLQRGEPCPLHGDGSNRRSFLYVTDVAEAFDRVLSHGIVGQIYNIGSDYEITNKGVLVKLLGLFDLADKETDFVRYVRDRAFNDFRYHINTSSLENLGWKQQVHFEEGLRLTKEWYSDKADYWGDITKSLGAHPTSDPSIKTTEKFQNAPSDKKQKAVELPEIGSKRQKKK